MDTNASPSTGLALRDYAAILWRRRWLFGVPALLVCLVALAYALIQTPVYRSEATILIEDAEIPEDLVTTLVGDYIEERLEAIDRRVMVTESLLAIIERYDLYPEMRRTMPVATLTEIMRENIGRRMIRADVIDPRSGNERAVTVAFQLSFDHPSPETAQRITNELVSLYLSQNQRRRQELASETTSFFQGELQQVEERIAELEERLAEFKQANAGSLPDQLPYNQQIVARAEQELRELDREAQALREREGYLQSQLVLAEPLSMGANGGYRSPAGMLEQKRTEFAVLSSRYGPDHPDIVKLEREINALEQSTGGGRSTGALEEERAARAEELEQLRQRYGEAHPDVQRAQRSLNGIESALQAARRGTSGAPTPDNPIYVQLQADLNAVRAELEAIQTQRAGVAARISQHQEQMLNTPLVEREYVQLRRTLDDAMSLRDELARKGTTASLGQTLEAELKAERLVLIEPATLPIVPVEPNRTMIALVGLTLALGCGAGFVTVAEALDEGVYGKDVVEIAGEAPLAVVPRITSPMDFRWRFATAAALAVIIAAIGLGVAVWWVHSRYMPLDLAYYDLQRRVQTLVAETAPPPAAAVER